MEICIYEKLWRQKNLFGTCKFLFHWYLTSLLFESDFCLHLLIFLFRKDLAEQPAGGVPPVHDMDPAEIQQYLVEHNL